MTGPSSQTITRVLVQFGLTARRITDSPGGHINDSFFVDAPTGEYVLQRINRTVFADPDALVANVVAVHRFLGGDIVPAPLRTEDGRWLVDDDGVWRLLERVPQAGPLPSPTSHAVGRAGELLGRFHARLAGLDADGLAVTLPGFHDPGRRLEQLRQVVADDPCDRLAACREEVGLAFAAIDLSVLADELAKGTPLRVAHNDAKLDNFLFRDGEAVAIVDLDTLMPGRWFWDVGDLLRSATTTAAEDDRALDTVSADESRYRSVLAGYRRGVGDAATRAELEAIEAAGALVTYEQALRFLTDWLAGDVYYRTTRAGQNLDRARNQLRLLASMPHSPL